MFRLLSSPLFDESKLRLWLRLNVVGAHFSQLGSELFVDEQVDEEVGQVVDVEGKSKVTADWFSKKDDVEERCEPQNKNHEQTETDFHCFHVARFSARVLTEIDSD